MVKFRHLIRVQYLSKSFSNVAMIYGQNELTFGQVLYYSILNIITIIDIKVSEDANTDQNTIHWI